MAKKKSPSDRRHQARKSAEKRERRAAARAAGVNIHALPADCVDCGSTEHRITTGAEIYPHRPDLEAKRFLICQCGGYVGFHAGTDIPLGRPAGRATQRARRVAHEAFDALWLKKAQRDGCSKSEARGKAYAWLAEALSIPAHACHIGWMSAQEAYRVRDLCGAPRRAAAPTIGMAGEAHA